MGETESDLEENAKRAAAQLNYDIATVPFYVSLGRFLHQYSILENIMLTVLISVSSVSHAVGKSIYSGTRIKAATDSINRILDATNRLDLKQRFKPYFDHVGNLTSMRDDILHYGAVYNHSRNVLTVSNERVAHIPTRLREYEVDTVMLDNMTHDASRAICGIILELLSGDIPKDALLFFQERIASPWRYKPPQPIALPPNNRRNPQSKRPRRAASDPKP